MACGLPDLANAHTVASRTIGLSLSTTETCNSPSEQTKCHASQQTKFGPGQSLRSEVFRGSGRNQQLIRRPLVRDPVGEQCHHIRENESPPPTRTVRFKCPAHRVNLKVTDPAPAREHRPLADRILRSVRRDVPLPALPRFLFKKPRPDRLRGNRVCRCCRCAAVPE